jgi:hypothetical protein
VLSIAPVICAHYPRRALSFSDREVVVCFSKPSNLQTFQRSNAPLAPSSAIPLSLSESALTDKHRVLPVFSRNRRSATSLECALPRVLLHKLFRMRSSEKTGGRGTPDALVPPNLSPPILRILFKVPYPVNPLFATLAKTPGVCTNNSHFGPPTRHSSLATVFSLLPTQEPIQFHATIQGWLCDSLP